MTLIETTLATAIMAVALVAVLGVLLKAQEANVLNRSRVLAFDAARGVIDQIKDLDAQGAAFPDALISALPGGTALLNNLALPNATRTIVWGAKADPTVVTVTVTWQDLRGHTANVSLTSAVGKN